MALTNKIVQPSPKALLDWLNYFLLQSITYDHDVFDRKPEFPKDSVTRGRSTEVIDPDDFYCRFEIAFPAECCGDFDHFVFCHGFRQDDFLIWGSMLIKQVEGQQEEDTMAILSVLSHVFLTWSASDPSEPVAIRIPSGTVFSSRKRRSPPLVTFSKTTVVILSNTGRFCRLKTRIVGLSVVSIANFQSAAVSLPSAGRITYTFGVQHTLASCSIGPFLYW